MGFVLMYSPCLVCGQPFGYNPNKVPSISVNEVRKPLCRTCVTEANTRRVAAGLSAFEIHPDAYEPIPEEELGY